MLWYLDFINSILKTPRLSSILEFQFKNNWFPGWIIDLFFLLSAPRSRPVLLPKDKVNTSNKAEDSPYFLTSKSSPSPCQRNSQRPCFEKRECKSNPFDTTSIIQRSVSISVCFLKKLLRFSSVSVFKNSNFLTIL